jgi:hypothetical protein
MCILFTICYVFKLVRKEYVDDSLNRTGVINYAQASLDAYKLEEEFNPEKITATKYESPKDYDRYYTLGINKSSFYATAYIDRGNSTDKRKVIIAYKGTSNQTDIYSDMQLMVINAFPYYAPQLSSLLINAFLFYDEVNNKLKADPSVKAGYDITITGHSLGGFIAAVVASEKGDKARIFSSPATYIASTALSPYQNSNIPMPNVINFVRYEDPVVNLSGRHVENMVYYPASPNYNLQKNPAASHSLTEFLEYLKAQPKPSAMYIYADAHIGSGTLFPINKYGATP